MDGLDREGKDAFVLSLHAIRVVEDNDFEIQVQDTLARLFLHASETVFHFAILVTSVVVDDVFVIALFIV